jgi:hypothetical protein
MKVASSSEARQLRIRKFEKHFEKISKNMKQTQELGK